MALLAIIKFISVSMKSELIFSVRKSKRTILTRISDALIETSQSIWIICVVRIVLLLPQPRLSLQLPFDILGRSRITFKVFHWVLDETYFTCANFNDAALRTTPRYFASFAISVRWSAATELFVHSQPMRYRGSSLFRL